MLVRDRFSLRFAHDKKPGGRLSPYPNKSPFETFTNPDSECLRRRRLGQRFVQLSPHEQFARGRRPPFAVRRFHFPARRGLQMTPSSPTEAFPVETLPRGGFEADLRRKRSHPRLPLAKKVFHAAFVQLKKNLPATQGAAAACVFSPSLRAPSIFKADLLDGENGRDRASVTIGQSFNFRASLPGKASRVFLAFRARAYKKLSGVQVSAHFKDISVRARSLSIQKRARPIPKNKNSRSNISTAIGGRSR